MLEEKIGKHQISTRHGWLVAWIDVNSQADCQGKVLLPYTIGSLQKYALTGSNCKVSKVRIHTQLWHTVGMENNDYTN